MQRRPIVVLTALDLEYEAVRARLVDTRPHLHEHGTRFRRGSLDGGSCEVVLALVGKGNHSAAVLAERAIAEFDPAAVFFVGVAGALKSGIELGDVVVATHVYAYQGGASEDDGLKSRPRSWETSHAADQLARELHRTGARKHRLPRGRRPTVHFGPIAAGELVLKSAVSDQARWVKSHYNDALAIEMEGAGVAQAGHLNSSLPVVVVRGISDRADRTKGAHEDARWQPEAAQNAVAFALNMAEAFADSRHAATRTTRGSDMGASFRNLATGNAQVGVQAGVIHGGVSLRGGDSPAIDLAAEIADLRRQVQRAHESGRLDDATYQAAKTELSVLDDSLDPELSSTKGALMIAMKKLRGLLDDLADLAAKVSVIMALVKGMS